MRYSVEAYCSVVRSTNRLGYSDPHLIATGLFGEIGSVMSVTKKLSRERDSFVDFSTCLVEEMGDVLWYLVAILQCARTSDHEISIAICKLLNLHNKSTIYVTITEEQYMQSLNNLCRIGTEFLEFDGMTLDNRKTLVSKFLTSYLHVLRWNDISLDCVIGENTKKVTSYFGSYDINDLPVFDKSYPAQERLPEKFEIDIVSDMGKTRVLYKGRQIGDSLGDNIGVEDGFRYHDTLHLANAAILNWSPTMRKILGAKRKSVPEVDENQDGGRAIVIEEGLVAWVFSRAKKIDYFKGRGDISIDILKAIQSFVEGYEVEACPMDLWRHCILSGYSVFRQVRENEGGRVVGDLNSRKLVYQELVG